jgi:LuxR family maltose regulon positive regulatory protein
MIPPLVVTKYTLPPPKPHQVVRHRLMKRLLAGLDRKLTLITAPAGFGKSTLALAFANAADRAVAWLSLDEADNDPMRWGAYLVAAVRHAGVAIDDQVMLLADEQTLDTLLGSLINALAAAGSPLLIVMDDYHVIRNDAIHAAVALLLDRLPPNVHVAIASRTRPPLPLAQLKVRAELVEIGATDLRFTPEEGSAFLHKSMGLNLSAQEEAQLVARTEGWVAALQLAALSLQGDPPAAISADHPDLVAYLLGEVLNQQAEPVRTFLLQTAILDVLTGSICTAVTGQPDGDRMLKALEQANLLVFPLDSERRAYRYHFSSRSRSCAGAPASPHLRPGSSSPPAMCRTSTALPRPLPTWKWRKRRANRPAPRPGVSSQLCAPHSHCGRPCASSRSASCRMPPAPSSAVSKRRNCCLRIAGSGARS